MGISEHPSRPKLLVWLGGFVVVFGVTAWLVTGGASVRVAPPSHSHPPGVTAAPLDCLSSEMKLVGSFNDCASIDSASSNCKVSPPAFNTLFKLLGQSQRLPSLSDRPRRLLRCWSVQVGHWGC
jgi:hypothetical protein